MTIRLPYGVTLKVLGPPSPLRFDIDRLFDFCPVDSSPPHILLTVYPEKPINELVKIVPDWLQANFDLASAGPLPHAVHGAAGEIAVLAANAFGGLLAVLSGDGKNIQATSWRKVDHAIPMVPSGLVIKPLLKTVFQKNGKLLAHGAGLKCPNGIGLAIIADKGGGKTTTALSLLRMGAHILADDLICFYVGGQHLLAQGVLEPVNLTPPTIKFFRELKHVCPAGVTGTEPGINGKIPTDIRQIYGKDVVIAESAIHVIYFVRVRAEGPRVDPATTEEAFGKLIASQIFAQGQKDCEDLMELLSKILTRTRVYYLSTGFDPEYLGQWLIDNCGRHVYPESR